MRLLVTGANGFLGSACLREILSRNTKCEQPLIVRGTTRERQRAPLAGVEYATVGEIGGDTNWRNALVGVHLVIHTAGIAHRLDRQNAGSMEEYRSVNLKGTLRLAEQAAAAGVKRLVFVSSIGVNGGRSRPGQAYSESDEPAPQNTYSWCKWEAERGLLHFAVTSGLEVVIVRPTLVYGPNAPGNFGTLARAICRDRLLPLGAIHSRRSFVGLDNLVDFLLVCATHTRAANETFLVSDGQDLTTTEFIQAMAWARGRKPRLLSVPPWALIGAATLVGYGGTVRRLCCDLQVSTGKAHRLLGWARPVSLEEGLRRAMSTVSDEHIEP